MAATTIQFGTETTLIASTSTTGSAPSGDVGFLLPPNADTVRTLVNYTGTVSSITIRLYVRSTGNAWYRAALDTDFGFSLTGIDEARDWLVQPGTQFAFVVESIAGGGSVVVTGVGVR